MTKAQIWELLVARNPAIESGRVTIKTEQLRRLVDFVYDKAVEVRGGGRDELPDVLMGLFGRK